MMGVRSPSTRLARRLAAVVAAAAAVAVATAIAVEVEVVVVDAAAIERPAPSLRPLSPWRRWGRTPLHVPFACATLGHRDATPSQATNRLLNRSDPSRRTHDERAHRHERPDRLPAPSARG